MLYDHPDVYDAIFRPEGHAAHYAALSERYPGPVLELACGTGQLTIPLARTGQHVVGLDASRAMLEAAERRGESAGLQVEYVESDMRTFELGRSFRLIFIARNSFLHLSEPADFVRTLTAVRRHLASDGVFAFDIFNPDVRLLARPAGQRFPVMEVSTASFGSLRVEATNDYDSATQVNRATWYVSTPDRQDAWVMPLALRSIFPQELPLLLSAAGLELVSRFGELSRVPFGAGSRVQVCLCRRRD